MHRRYHRNVTARDFRVQQWKHHEPRMLKYVHGLAKEQICMYLDVRGDIKAAETVWAHYANVPNMWSQARSFNECSVVARIATDSAYILAWFQRSLGRADIWGV